MTNNIFNTPRERIYFSSFISDTLENKINTWDVQYLFMLRVQNQLSIYPSVNLVTNIGLFSSDATHTVAKQTSKLYVKSQVIKPPLKHPKYVFRNKKLDDRISKRNFFSWKRLLRYLLNDY